VKLLVIAIAAALTAVPQSGPVIESFDVLSFNAPKEKASAELVPGRTGQAVRFSFEAEGRGTFYSRPARATPEWDRGAGISFWLKGDGSDHLGGLQLIFDEDYAVRYDLAFPLKSTEWTKVTVPWRDFIPVLPGPRAKPLGGPDGNPPSKVTGLWVGKWWYWGDYPAHSFAVDDLRIEPAIPVDTIDYTPKGHPLARSAAKLRAGRPLNIVTMGDSLTDFRHWANRQTSWPNLLKEIAAKKHGAEVTIRNPAVGGTQLRQNLVLIPGWIDDTPAPDLVTVFFGPNDYEAGMRGPEFEAACIDAVRRIRRATRGRADVLLITTIPSVSRWGLLAEMAAAVRSAAARTKAGAVDAERAFLAAGMERKERLFVNDGVHLSPEGHALVADTVYRALSEASR
jgi:lysophospholipase L1-like esterase